MILVAQQTQNSFIMGKTLREVDDNGNKANEGIVSSATGFGRAKTMIPSSSGGRQLITTTSGRMAMRKAKSPPTTIKTRPERLFVGQSTR